MKRTSFVAAVLWLLGCPLAGLVVALVTLRNDSPIWFVFGVALGVGGGAASAALYSSRHFCALPAHTRIALIFVGAMLFCLFIGGYTLGWDTKEMPFLALSLAPSALLATYTIDRLVLRPPRMPTVLPAALSVVADVVPLRRRLANDAAPQLPRPVTQETPATPPAIPPASLRE